MFGYGWRDDDRDDFTVADGGNGQTELPEEWQDPGAPPAIPGRNDDRVEIMARKNGDEIYGITFFDPTDPDADAFIDADPDTLVELGP